MHTATDISYRIVVEPDSEYFDFANEEQLFTLISFSNRHSNYQHPDEVLACTYEDENGICGEMPWVHSDGKWNDLFAGGDVAVIDDHTYTPQAGLYSPVSYYEHGSSRWSLIGEGSNDPWDAVRVAGMLKVNLGADEQDWWDGLDEDVKDQYARTYCDEYTSWANGDIYTICVQKRYGDGPWRNLEARTIGGIIGADEVEAVALTYAPELLSSPYTIEFR